MGSVLGFALLFCCRFVLKKKTKKKTPQTFFIVTLLQSGIPQHWFLYSIGLK